jgi:hypothetical protein
MGKNGKKQVQTLSSFMSKWRKGSKYFRIVMEHAGENVLNKRIKKFAKIVAENTPNESSAK